MELTNFQNFNDAPFIKSFDLKTTFDLNEIYYLLQKEKWVKEDIAIENENDNSRSLSSNINRTLQNFKITITSDEFKKHLIDLIFSWEQFHYNWTDITKERLFNITKIHAQFKKNLPNHEGTIHQESRNTICAGMIYFIPYEDENQSTVFYVNNDFMSPVYPPTGMGKGWIAMNIWSHTHQGRNLSMDDRYTLVFFLNLLL
jgi:hypothetical protein